MKDRRTREELALALAEATRDLQTATVEIKTWRDRAESATKERDSLSARYYKFLEEDRERSVLIRGHADEIEDLARRHSAQIIHLSEQAQRYAAMRGAVIALAGKAKADEIDGYSAA